MINNIEEYSNDKNIIEALEDKDLFDETLEIDGDNFAIESVSKVDKSDYRKTYMTKINLKKLDH